MIPIQDLMSPSELINEALLLSATLEWDARLLLRNLQAVQRQSQQLREPVKDSSRVGADDGVAMGLPLS